MDGRHRTMEEINRIKLRFRAKQWGWIKEHMGNQTELAVGMGISNVSVCKIFSGGGGVTFRTDWNFANALKVDFISRICKRLRKGKR